jgi:hypothetical protein
LGEASALRGASGPFSIGESFGDSSDSESSFRGAFVGPAAHRSGDLFGANWAVFCEREEPAISFRKRETSGKRAAISFRKR